MLIAYGTEIVVCEDVAYCEREDTTMQTVIPTVIDAPQSFSLSLSHSY
jgi:hypothetical protein